MFNVREKVFRDVVQIQVFSSPIYYGSVVKERFSFQTGEIFPKNKKVCYSPFEDDLIAYVDLDEEKSTERSLRRTRIKIMDILRCNMFSWFLTLTFDPCKVDSFNYEFV